MIIDPLEETQLEVPVMAGESERIALVTVASEGFEIWLKSFIHSIKMNSGLMDRIDPWVICVGEVTKEIHTLCWENKFRVCHASPLRDLASTTKACVYSFPSVVKRKGYIMADADIICLESWEELLFRANEDTIYAARDSAWVNSAVQSRYRHALFKQSWTENSRCQYPHPAMSAVPGSATSTFCINDGLLVGNRESFLKLEEKIRELYALRDENEPRHLNCQRYANLALIALEMTEYLDEKFNLQGRAPRIGLKRDGDHMKFFGGLVHGLHLSGKAKSDWAEIQERYR